MGYAMRDMGLNYIEERKGTFAYGMGLGILILDEEYTVFPGDLRNASAFNFPIQYEIVKGLDCDLLIRGKDKSPALKPIIEACKNLEKMGCKVISGECGYFAYFQKEVTEALNVPAYMSSLLQVPWAQRAMSSKKSVGILCAEKNCLTDEHLKAAGIDLNSNIVIGGARDDYKCESFETLFNHSIGDSFAYYEKNEKEIVEMAKDFTSKNPNMGALVLECTSMNPFVRAVQRAIDMPVYSWGTLLDYAYSVVVHKDYYGHI